MDLILKSKKIARENLAERLARELCCLVCQIDNISASFQKSGNNIFLAVTFFCESFFPQEFFWLNIDIARTGREIEVIWDKLIPSQKISLSHCGILQRSIINYVSLRRGELLALLCYKKFATIA